MNSSSLCMLLSKLESSHCWIWLTAKFNMHTCDEYSYTTLPSFVLLNFTYDRNLDKSIVLQCGLFSITTQECSFTDVISKVKFNCFDPEWKKKCLEGVYGNTEQSRIFRNLEGFPRNTWKRFKCLLLTFRI